MTYASELAAISRTPVDLAVITLDYCDEVFGEGSCAATGSGDAKCYNTYATCRDTDNYNRSTKDYKFTSADVPAHLLAFHGARPYILEIQDLPTEIKDNLTSTGKRYITFLDEPDTDIGIDPYYSGRTNANQGTFWKKLIARNPNYIGKRIRLYHGFDDLDEGDYEQKFEGVIEAITFNADGTITVEAGDVLKSIEDIMIPPETDCALAADIDDSTTAISVYPAAGIASSGYIRCGDEIIKYDGMTGNVLDAGNVVRGYFNTTAAAHSKDDAIQQVKYYAPQLPYDIISEMLLTDAALAAGYVDSTALTALKALDKYMVYFSAIITEPTSARVLLFEVVDLCDCKCWVGEDNKVTFAKNLPNYPDRAYTTITDADNILIDSDGLDLNADSRISRITMHWNKDPVGVEGDPAYYVRKSQEKDTAGESANKYGSVKEKVIFCRWLRDDYMDEDLIKRYITNLLKRMIRLYKDPMPLYSFSVEMKDNAVKTGQYVRIDTDKIVDRLGAALSGQVFQVVKRGAIKNGRIDMTVLQYPVQKICFTGASTLPVYASATVAQKEFGFFTNTLGKMNDDDEGYYTY
jgi:hypothetical protein